MDKISERFYKFTIDMRQLLNKKKQWDRIKKHNEFIKNSEIDVYHTDRVLLNLQFIPRILEAIFITVFSVLDTFYSYLIKTQENDPDAFFAGHIRKFKNSLTFFLETSFDVLKMLWEDIKDFLWWFIFEMKLPAPYPGIEESKFLRVVYKLLMGLVFFVTFILPIILRLYL